MQPPLEQWPRSDVSACAEASVFVFWLCGDGLVLGTGAPSSVRRAQAGFVPPPDFGRRTGG